MQIKGLHHGKQPQNYISIYMKNRTRNERRRARREAVRGVVVTICFLVALFADSWVEWIL